VEKLTEIKAVSCEKCGYIWLPRVKNPVKCPKCGYRFDSKIVKKPNSFLPKKENKK
jgi:predicted Zn-ribbon and HTH transcriptional regulator